MAMAEPKRPSRRPSSKSRPLVPHTTYVGITNVKNDEPTGNLDPAISLGIMKLLDRINRAGTTVVMATHDREMVDSLRKRVIALEAGHIVRDQEKGGYGYYGAL